MTTNIDGQPKYQPTSTNMVHVVESIISGYRMREMRALAQEPVQNSKDAKRSITAKVEYRLHQRTLCDGAISHMLTVTDTGTSGLGGAILSADEINERGGVLDAGEDWAAFEGQGYTKANQDTLGSRGQGKAAFLYHSVAKGVLSSSQSHRRMVMLYDTLLPGGEYRLGVRYANPLDTVRQPPYMEEQARSLVSSDSFSIDNDLEYPLRLSPLTEVGTRVIVPYLSGEAIDSFRNGELARWLEMCWWRAIQVRELEITVVDSDGVSHHVGVPKWWRTEFWKGSKDALSEKEYLKEDVALSSDPGLKIKRIVLTQDDDIEEHKHLFDRSEPEYDGIQIMRGLQWIETFDVRTIVPEEHRAGFRGFVEFERDLDRTLRSIEYESPQHDSFNARMRLVRNVKDEVIRHVKEFCELRGWISDDATTVDPSELEREIATSALSVLVNPPVGKPRSKGKEPGGTLWDLSLQVDYPNEGTTRVDWGQVLSNLYIRCGTEPKRNYGSVTLKVLSVAPNGEQTAIASKRVDMREDGTASSDFGDLSILKGGAKEQHMVCPEAGKYSLCAVISDAGSDLKRASRAVYVQEDPPDPPAVNPITLSVEASNQRDPERIRINDGETLRIATYVTNRHDVDAALSLDVAIVASELPGNLVAGIDAPESLQLAAGKQLNVSGIERHGERAVPKPVLRKRVRLLTDLPTQPVDGAYLVAAPGTHNLRIDLYDKDRQRIASVGRRIYFEVDPPGKAGRIPFDIQKEESVDESVEASALWRLESPIHQDEPYTLCYSSRHHIYKIAERADSTARRRSVGTKAVMREIVADAYLDWMHEAHRENDDSRYDTILDRPDQVNNPRWIRLADQVERFRAKSDQEYVDTESLAELRRQVVANLVRIFEKEAEEVDA